MKSTALDSGIPDMAGYERQPRGWQAECMRLVDLRLRDASQQSEGQLNLARPILSTYTTGKWGVVQVWYDRMWTLHVQCEFDHNQVRNDGMYRIRISLDFGEWIERRRQLTENQVADLRRRIKGGVRHKAVSNLGDDADIVGRDDWNYVIQDWMRISDPLQDVQAIAGRMVQYVVGLMPDAIAAVDEWLAAH